MSHSVTLPFSDYKTLLDQVESLKKELGDARQETEQARLNAGEADNRNLSEALNSCIEIARFSMGHLHPMTVRGFPHQHLRTVARLLPDLPGIDPAVKEVHVDWRLSADDYKTWEDARENGTEQELLHHDNAIKGAKLDAFGPAITGQVVPEG